MPWLWQRLAAAGPTGPLAQELTYATGTAIKRRKKKKVNIPPTPTLCPYNMCQNWSDKIVRIRLSLAHRCWTALESIFFTSYEGFPSLIPQKFAPSFIILEMLLLPHPGHFYFFLNCYLKKKKKVAIFPFCLLVCCSRGPLFHFYTFGTCSKSPYPAQRITPALRVISQGCSSQKQGSITQGRNAMVSG